MSVSQDATVDGPVRMALGWYPGMLAEDSASPLSQPKAIVTEDVVYESSFPVSYRFHLYRPKIRACACNRVLSQNPPSPRSSRSFLRLVRTDRRARALRAQLHHRRSRIDTPGRMRRHGSQIHR